MTDTLSWTTWTDTPGFQARTPRSIYAVEPTHEGWQWSRWDDVPRDAALLLDADRADHGHAETLAEASAGAEADWSAECASLSAHEPLHAAVARAETARDDAARVFRRAPKLEKHDASLRLRAARTDLEIARWNLADAEAVPA